MAWPPDERPHYEQCWQVLPEAMGSEAFERARTTGASMPTKQAIDLALGAGSAS